MKMIIGHTLIITIIGLMNMMMVITLTDCLNIPLEHPIFKTAPFYWYQSLVTKQFQ